MVHAYAHELAETVRAMNEGCGQRKPCASCDAREDAADAIDPGVLNSGR
jgi:hypothetical protein